MVFALRGLFLFLLLCNVAFFTWRAVESPVGKPAVMDVPDAQGNIVLLSELPGGGLDRASLAVGDGKEVVQPESVVPVQEECWVLGGFDSLAAMPDVGSVLIRAKKEVFEQEAEYWVVLGPFEGLTQAEAMGAEIQGKGWDSFVIARGALKNAVSVGVFRERPRAERQRQLFVSRGYQAVVEPVSKSRARYWLSLRGDSSKPLFKKELDRLRSFAIGGLVAEKKNCNFVASLKDFD